VNGCLVIVRDSHRSSRYRRFQGAAVDKVQVVVLSCPPSKSLGTIDRDADHSVRQRLELGARNNASIAPCHETESSEDANGIDSDSKGVRLSAQVVGVTYVA
jgi:hypothetical protein